MKQKRSLRAIVTSLWQRFPVPAAVCLLAAGVSIAATAVLAGQMGQPPVLNTLRQLENGLMLGVVLSVLASLLPVKPVLCHALAIAGASAGVALGLLPLDHVYGGTMVAALCLCFFFACGRTAPEFRLNQILGWFFSCLGMSLVSYSALMLTWQAATALFFPDISYSVRALADTVLGALSFLIVAPWLFLGGLPQPEDAPDGRSIFRTFVSKVLLPLSLLLMAVLLLYVARIAVTLTMPVGTMNGYALAALALYAFFALTLTGDEGVIARFFHRFGAWLLLPVMVVQQIGVWIRIDAYGFTAARIAGLVITVLLAAVVVSGLIRKRPVWFFPAAAVLAVIFIATPLNCSNLALNNQSARLTAALERNGMLAPDGSITANPNADTDDRSVIWSASEYLLKSDFGEATRPLTRQLRRQLWLSSDPEPDAPQPDLTQYQYHNRADITALLGFSKPNVTLSSVTWRFEGSAERSSLDVRGYDHVTYRSVSAAVSGDLDVERDHVAIDTDAILMAMLSTGEGAPAFPDTPVVLHLDGDEVELQPMLASAALTGSPTASDAAFTLTQDRIPLPSGRELYVDYVSLYYHTYNSSVSVTLCGWIMTPTPTQP